MSARRPAKYGVIYQFHMAGNRPHGVIELGTLLRGSTCRHKDGNEQNERQNINSQFRFLAGLLAFWSEPNCFGGWSSQNGISCIQFNGHGLVVVLAGDSQAFAGADAGFVQKEEKLGVALLEAGYDVLAAFKGLGKRSFAPAFALCGADGQDGVAMGAGSGFAEFLFEF
jgi:hypothetical protein